MNLDFTTGLIAQLGVSPLQQINVPALAASAAASAASAALNAGTTINVKTYGAKCDGVTDDTVAVAKAMMAASVALAGDYWGDVYPTVEFPPGLCFAVVDLPPGVSIRGGGSQSTVIATPAGRNRSTIRMLPMVSAPAFHTGVFTRQTIERIKIDGNGNAQTAGHCIEVVDASYSMGTSYGIGATITDVVAVGAKQDGIYLGANRNWNLLTRVISQYHGRNALSSFSYDTRVVASDFGATPVGVNLYAGGAHDFHGCNIFTCTQTGFVKADACGGYNWFVGGTIGGCGERSVYLVKPASETSPEQNTTAFIGTDFSNASINADGALPNFDLVNGPCVVIRGGRFHRDISGPRTSYLVRQTGTGTATLYWSNPVFEQFVAASIPYSVGMFTGAMDIRGSYSALAPSGARYERHDEPQEFTTKLRWQDDSQPADYRAWLLAGDSQVFRVLATNDGESSFAAGLTISRTVVAGNQTITKVQLGGAAIVAPPSYATDTAAGTGGLTTGQMFWNTTTTAYARKT